MDHKSKIYEAIQYPFEKRKDDLGSKVSCNVRKGRGEAAGAEFK